MWGNDYPHAEGTFRGSRELIAKQFAGVPADERAAMVGGTLGGLLGFDGAGRRLTRPSGAIPRMKMSANGFATSRADTRPPAFSHRYV